MKHFSNKRKQVARHLPRKGVLILASPPEHFRQKDIKHPYRQASNLYYLTGFEEPESLFLLFPSGRAVLFCAGPDPVKDIWEGPRLAPKFVQRKFLLDKVWPLAELEKRLPGLLKGCAQVFYDNDNPFFDPLLKRFGSHRHSAEDFLKDFRKIKDKTEIAHIKKAISISIYAHKQVARALRPGINENALYGIFIKSIREKGAMREAYGAIVACGAAACVLHYQKNEAVCRAGRLLLVDAGAESDYYSSDITRVYPVSGKFSLRQRSLYKKLLNLQQNLIKEIRPGIELTNVDQQMREGLTHILIEEGFLSGGFSENMKKKTFKKYCPHSVGHLMGLDVHDIGWKKKEKRILKAGMVLTIEPGIYISPQDQKAPRDLKGVGLRIEDDILVTSSGQKNLSQALVKDPDEIEALCQEKA